jgi:signal transduction protein with GAF and PtsI domain
VVRHRVVWTSRPRIHHVVARVFGRIRWTDVETWELRFVGGVKRAGAKEGEADVVVRAVGVPVVDCYAHCWLLRIVA